MEFFVYLDNRRNAWNPQENTYPRVRIHWMGVAPDIVAADAACTAATGVSPVKSPWLGCLFFKPDELARWVQEQYNEAFEARAALREHIARLDHRIYGLENPWVLKQPDYLI